MRRLAPHVEVVCQGDLIGVGLALRGGKLSRGEQVDLDPVGASVDCRARHREAPAHEGTPWLADEMAVKADVGDCVEAV